MAEDSIRLPAGMPTGLALGAVVAGYQVDGQIGAGGMAVVYRARDVRLGRQVALKVLAPALANDEEFRARFIREWRAATAVEHPHIIPVYAADEADGVLYIAMRLVNGGDLASLVRRTGPLAAEQTTAFMSAVASALDAAHSVGLVHRDIKPGNMLLDSASGLSDHVYLSDFGLTKSVAGATALTGTGTFMGTPDYVSPEQITDKGVDGRADQYALACVTVALLTGRPPYTRTEQMALLWAHMSDPAPSIVALRPELPRAVDAVIARGMAKSPDDRYPSCGAFAAALRQALGTPTSPLPAMRASDPGTHPATVLSPPRGTTAAPGSPPHGTVVSPPRGSMGAVPATPPATPSAAPARGFAPTERAPAPAAFTTPPAGPAAGWPPAGGPPFSGGAFSEPPGTARMPGAGGTGAGGHPAWDRGTPEPRSAPGQSIAPQQAAYQPPPAPFRGTPPSAQSAIRRPPAERTGRAGWLSDNVHIRPILIGVGVIVVLIIIYLTTHG
jgi:serine/threonine-protein kinase